MSGCAGSNESDDSGVWGDGEREAVAVVDDDDDMLNGGRKESTQSVHSNSGSNLFTSHAGISRRGGSRTRQAPGHPVLSSHNSSRHSLTRCELNRVYLLQSMRSCSLSRL